MTRIDELLQQRAAIDAELLSLRDEASRELEQVKQKLDAVNAALGATPVRPAPVIRAMTPLDETDAGNGVGEYREAATDAQSFTDELADLRARSQARRRR